MFSTKRCAHSTVQDYGMVYFHRFVSSGEILNGTTVCFRRKDAHIPRKSAASTTERHWWRFPYISMTWNETNRWLNVRTWQVPRSTGRWRRSAPIFGPVSLATLVPSSENRRHGGLRRHMPIGIVRQLLDFSWHLKHILQ